MSSPDGNPYATPEPLPDAPAELGRLPGDVGGRSRRQWEAHIRQQVRQGVSMATIRAEVGDALPRAEVETYLQLEASSLRTTGGILTGLGALTVAVAVLAMVLAVIRGGFHPAAMIWFPLLLVLGLATAITGLLRFFTPKR